MRSTLSPHINRLILLVVAATLTGWVFGSPMGGLAVALVLYLVWTLLQLARLYRWLNNRDASIDPPESTGLWGTLFDDIYRLQKRHFETRNRLELMINRVRESTNSLRDGVVMTDARGAMEWWNHAAEYLCGFRSGKDEGEFIYNLIRDPGFRVYFETKDYSEPLEIVSPARPRLRLQIQINLFGEEDRLVTIKDVTRLHQLETMRRDFVSNVSHEMRTPLTVISGYLETLADQTEQIPRGWKRPLATMQHHASRMEALIHDLLLLSKLETSERRTGDALCQPGPLLRQIRDDAVALSGDQNHRITLNVEDEQAIQGDEEQLHSAFSNLVFNAVKYTPSHGHIDIHYRVEDNGIHLSITDDGPGIDAEHIPRLTERFYRADPSRSKETGGTGLGLAIVKHILYNHEGELLIDSTPGEGSTFTCVFPLKRLSPENGQ